MPSKPNTRTQAQISLRIDRGILERIRAAAEADGRSINNWVVMVLNGHTQNSSPPAPSKGLPKAKSAKR